MIVSCLLQHLSQQFSTCGSPGVVELQLPLSLSSQSVLKESGKTLLLKLFLFQPVPMDNPYKEPPKKCVLCGVAVDYKNVQLLSQFISPYSGHIFGRHITGLCMKKQQEVAKNIKRARQLGFMSVTYKDPTFLSDPKVCSIKYPE
uniref:Small ribosomal subunit protein bS18m n=1 Tax=Podarcis muralis TaxID=64176 RepID=A0A670KGC9_PODMU